MRRISLYVQIFAVYVNPPFHDPDIPQAKAPAKWKAAKKRLDFHESQLFFKRCMEFSLTATGNDSKNTQICC